MNAATGIVKIILIGNLHRVFQTHDDSRSIVDRQKGSDSWHTTSSLQVLHLVPKRMLNVVFICPAWCVKHTRIPLSLQSASIFMKQFGQFMSLFWAYMQPADSVWELELEMGISISSGALDCHQERFFILGPSSVFLPRCADVLSGPCQGGDWINDQEQPEKERGSPSEGHRLMTASLDCFVLRPVRPRPTTSARSCSCSFANVIPSLSISMDCFVSY